MNNAFNKRRKFILFPLAGLAFAALAGWIVMLLWNAILPGLITGVGAITYFKAVGLLILCRILFGGFRGPRGGQHNFRGRNAWKEKMMNMSEEEKAAFKAEWKSRCGR